MKVSARQKEELALRAREQAREKMRAGVRLITSWKIYECNIDAIIETLRMCDEHHSEYLQVGGCDECEDLNVCISAFDKRAEIDDILCRYCKKKVPKIKYCRECGGKRINEGKWKSNNAEKNEAQGNIDISVQVRQVRT